MRTLTFGSDGLKSSDVTPEDVRNALGIPEVMERPVAFRGEQFWKTSDKHKAIVAKETGFLYAIHSDNYRLVKHEEGILSVMGAVEKNPEYGQIEWKASEFDNFKRFHAKGVFTDIPYEIRKDDIINPTLEYTNSYDGYWTEGLVFGAYRVLCANGMTVGEQFFRESARHTGEERERMIINLEDALHGFSMQTDLWKGWLDKELAIANVDSLENLELTKKEKALVIEGVDEQPEMDVWTFYNILTALITHKMTSLNKRIYTWGRLQRETRNW